MKELTPHQQKALNYKKHITLTANAGSGKTFVFARRYVEIVVNENINLNNLIAITFTDKAAGELYKKIADEIDERIEYAEDKNTKRKLEKARRQLVSANISTIHSFCINLLREFPAEIGIDANFTPIDELDSSELIEQSIEESINHELNGGANSEVVKYLVRILGSKSSLSNQLTSAVKRKRVIEKLSQQLYSKDENDIADYYQKKFEFYFEKLFSEKLKSLFQSLRIINNAVLEIDPSNKNAETADVILTEAESLKNSQIEQLECLPKFTNNVLTTAGTVRKPGYSKKLGDEYQSLIENINSNYKELSAIRFEKDFNSVNKGLAEFGKNFIILFREIEEDYLKRKKANGYLDFEDILLYTEELVENKNVLNYLTDKFKFIMIDEYQDTNELQYNIFMPILENLKKGNLFVVGDEKQSIYMFRDAELEVFNRTKNEIRKIDPEESILNLPHSFRLSPNIAFVVNYIFKNLFAQPELEFNEVEHNDLICSNSTKSEGEVELIFCDPELTDQSESEMVAGRILEDKLTQDSFRFGDIAILCRKRNAFIALENSLSKHNIPYLIIGGKGFYQRQSINDVYNYLSFLVNQKNDAAFVGLLRSPFYNIPDSHIYEMSLKNGNSFWEKFNSYARQNNKYQKEYELLKKHVGIAHRIEINQLLRQILRETGYWSVIANRKDAHQEIANLEKLVEITNKYSNNSYRTIYDFTSFLKSSIDTYVDESQASVVSDDNAVKIMTIHQAKGLEFNTVILYGSNDTVRDDNIKSKSMVIDKNFGILTKVPKKNAYFEDYLTAPINTIYNYITSKKNIAEFKRLLYVAMTRAINKLIISATLKDGKVKNNSFLDFISQGLQNELLGSAVIINGKLGFMNFENGFKQREEQIEYRINIIREPGEQNIHSAESGIEKPRFDFLIKDITDAEKNEIVSATKIAIFSQCPVKYYLTYELGYGKLFTRFKNLETDYDFNYKENDETNEYADVKGRIIHKLLEDSVSVQKVDEAIEVELEKELLGNVDRKKSAELKKVISEDVTNYLNSNIYKKISSHINFYNEYEIYSKKENYYLYGIVDKLVINDGELFIIDYKTDNISPNDINRKAENYIPQLKFYCYTLSQRFRRNKYIVRLIFIKQPDVEFVQEFTFEQIEQFGKSIDRIITKIRNKEFEFNYSHCPICHFSDSNNKCILNKTS
ncbi:MAG: UvrD-helicase domain-containing protein [Melioribacteraceae bacterium]|nr:UvrD-helicase domain-containing protein [Melioribacteraceae bacterium]MCF8355809.1 UvrD-helicase domain-containing protein [Melioribacteraceae bacterium]MCF8395299.1 UvrD-helicase domain-containing protein [Melioribacteraceae bacterium]MCF8420747.1 UvrD-helicase domain-containing protein [Melioribacteraceae bacterium]